MEHCNHAYGDKQCGLASVLKLKAESFGQSWDMPEFEDVIRKVCYKYHFVVLYKLSSQVSLQCSTMDASNLFTELAIKLKEGRAGNIETLDEKPELSSPRTISGCTIANSKTGTLFVICTPSHPDQLVSADKVDSFEANRCVAWGSTPHMERKEKAGPNWKVRKRGLSLLYNRRDSSLTVGNTAVENSPEICSSRLLSGQR
jgi:hypothetical protein